MDTPLTLPQELWDRLPPEVRAYIETLKGQVKTLTSMVHTLQEQVRTLQEQLNQTSRNSSRPPSSDPPQSQRPRRPRGQRRRGGQPGHPGHTRSLVPVEEVDEVVVLKPDQCRGCHAPLSGDDATPFRHQVIEIPPIKPVITEYRWHQLVCPECGETTRAPWPDGVPSGTYGPRVHATVALCTGSYRLSKRTTGQVMDDLFGVPMSVGTISQSEKATTEVVAEPVEEARASVQEQAVAHLDETSWRQGDKRAWLWVAVTSLVTVFVVRLSRGGHVARELLGEGFSGILVQVPIKGGLKSCGLGHWAVTFGHHFSYRFSRPLKRMGMFIPFCDKGHQPLRQVLLVRKIGDPQPLALQDREPLLDLVHPGTMHGREMKEKAWVLSQPGLQLFALVHPHIIKHHVHRRDTRGNLPIDMFQKHNEFHLTFAFGRGGIDLPGACVKPGKQIQRSFADILVLDPHWPAWLCGQGRRFPGPGLQTGYFLYAQHHFPDAQE